MLYIMICDAYKYEIYVTAHFVLDSYRGRGNTGPRRCRFLYMLYYIKIYRNEQKTTVVFMTFNTKQESKEHSIIIMIR